MVDQQTQRPTRMLAIAAALVLLGGTACGKKAAIEGTVLDGFGKPLSGATVSIDKTTFSATSDASGQYSVGYVPGQILTPHCER